MDFLGWRSQVTLFADYQAAERSCAINFLRGSRTSCATTTAQKKLNDIMFPFLTESNTCQT